MRLVVVLSLILSATIACIPMKVTGVTGCSALYARPATDCDIFGPFDPPMACYQADVTLTKASCKNAAETLVIGSLPPARISDSKTLECRGMKWYLDDGRTLFEAIGSTTAPVLCIPE